MSIKEQEKPQNFG